MDVSGNMLQGVITGGEAAGSDINYSNNTMLPFSKTLSDTVTSAVEIRYNGKTVTDLTTTSGTVDLNDVEFVEVTDENGKITRKSVTDKNVKWYTSVEEIGTVSESGIVTRKKYGTVKVYAVPLDGSTAYGECSLTFEKAKASDIKGADSITLQPGLKKYAQCSVLPENASQELVYSSSNTLVATVSKGGRIQAVSIGECDITCLTTDGSNIKKVIHVTVENSTVKKITLNQSWKYFSNSEIGNNYQLSVSQYYPSDAVNKSISRWESTNESAATVSNTGLVTITGDCQATIKAYSSDGSCYGKCNIYVQPDKVSDLVMTGISDTTASISWSPVENCGGYNVYLWNSTALAWEAVKTDYNDTSYTFRNLTPGQSYKYCVKAYVTNWYTSTPTRYESDNSEITITTDSYVRVSSIYSEADYVTLITGAEPIWTFNGQELKNKTISVSAKPGNTENTELEISIENPEMATIVRTVNAADGSYELYIRGEHAGYTNIIVKAKDAGGYIKKIPVGIFDKCTINQFSGQTAYGNITLSFNGLDNEDGIDGYVIRRIQGYRNVEPIYIPKTGDSKYTYTLSSGLVPGSTYGYRVFVYSEKNGIYYERNQSTVNDLVMPETVAVSSIDIGDSSRELEALKEINIRAVILPENASVQELDWIIDNEEIAQLTKKKDSQGNYYVNIRGLSDGTANLKAISRDGSGTYASCQIVVYSRKSLKDRGITVTMPSTVNYTGKTVCPSIVIRDGTKVLKNKTDYTLSFSNAIKPGKASVTVTGIGKYTGTIIKTFTIVKKAAAVNKVESKLIAPKSVKAVNSIKGITVSWKKVKNAYGYYIYRKTKSGALKRIATVKSGSTVKYTDKKAANGKQYYYYVSAYSKTKKVGTKSKAVKAVRISRSIIRSVKFKAKGKMQVSWRKNTKVTGYQIKYVSGSKVRTVTVKGSRKVSRVITGLKKGKLMET